MPSQPHSTHQRRSSAERTRSKKRLRIAVISPPQCGQDLPCGNSRYTTAVTIAIRSATVASRTTTISMLNLSARLGGQLHLRSRAPDPLVLPPPDELQDAALQLRQDRKSTRLNSSHMSISYAVFCLKKKKHHPNHHPFYKQRTCPYRAE